jgi:anti-sigma-K factor RskA
MSVERHHAQEENVGAFLLGALTEIEERAFERHLTECPVCRDEVERLRPAVEALPRSVPPVDPPPRLKASLMEAVEADSRSRAGAPRRSPLAALRERLAAAGEALGGMRPAMVGASAAIVLVLAGLTGYAVTQVGSEAGDSSQTLAAKVDKGRIPLASGSLVVPGEEQKGGILRVHGMPTLGKDAVYQVWLKRNGETISQSLFNVGRDGDGAAAVSEDLSGADAVLVTRERAGGARAPSEEPVLSVTL